MSKSPKKTGQTPAVPRIADPPSQADFDEIVRMIEAARARAFAAVNTELINLYWNIGEYISRRVAANGWGKGTVEALAEAHPPAPAQARGFSARNLWRMMQFYETYRGQPKLAPLLRELSWTHNLIIMSRSKRDEEREFYLRVCIRERWTKRELQRQVAGALFERTVLSPAKLSPAVTELHPDAAASSRTRICSISLTFRRAFRGRLAPGPDRAAQAVPDRAGPRLLFCWQRVPAPGRRAGLRPRPALLQPGAQLPWSPSN